MHRACGSLIGSYGTSLGLFALKVVIFGVFAAGRETCTNLIVSIVDCRLLREVATSGIEVYYAWSSHNVTGTQARRLSRQLYFDEKADDDQQYMYVSHFIGQNLLQMITYQFKFYSNTGSKFKIT